MDEDIKKKFEKYLAANDAYGAILSKVKDEGERKKIKAFTEEFYMTLVQGFFNAQKIVQENPEKVAELLDKKISK